jgi:hypothetical protein
VSEVINLNRARKARVKAEAAKTADANRARHGRTRAEKDAARREVERTARALDQARREDT